jgi:hypothetical protein
MLATLRSFTDLYIPGGITCSRRAATPGPRGPASLETCRPSARRINSGSSFNLIRCVQACSTSTAFYAAVGRMKACIVAKMAAFTGPNGST